MKYYGKEIYCARGETFSLMCTLVDEDDAPFRISSELSNAYLLLTVAGTKYAQRDRYLLRNWISLSDFPKVKDMSIPSFVTDPLGEDILRHQVFYNSTERKYKIYDEKELKYVEYAFNLIHTFTSEVTVDWIEQVYDYDLHLVSGDVNPNIQDSTNIVPLSKIRVDIELIPKTKIYVSSNLNGGLNG